MLTAEARAEWAFFERVVDRDFFLKEEAQGFEMTEENFFQEEGVSDSEKFHDLFEVNDVSGSANDPS